MSGMTHDERVVGALIPTVPHRPKPLPIPLALLPGPPRPSSTLTFDMARPYLSGRISIRGLLGALAWTSDVRLDLAITTEMMTFAVRVAGQHGVAGLGRPTMRCWRITRSTRLRLIGRPWARSSTTTRGAPYSPPDAAWIARRRGPTANDDLREPKKSSGRTGTGDAAERIDALVAYDDALAMQRPWLPYRRQRFARL
jgi:hypothetical protein